MPDHTYHFQAILSYCNGAFKKTYRVLVIFFKKIVEDTNIGKKFNFQKGKHESI